MFPWGSIWILIPLAGILAGTFKEWMKFKATQRQLGASTDELEREMAEVRKLNEALQERVQNLEAIVVSQTWDALHDHGLSAAERELKVASVARRELKPPDTATANQQRAEQLAHRLQG
ncbi:MAG TPA: hypothetical protein VLV54_21770 [Thermoanaerobaculia bacterium]|nr:hypothetical protein [Thermoanaerobaculia bacterium]